MNRRMAFVLLLSLPLLSAAAQEPLSVEPSVLLADAAEVRDVEISRFGSYIAIYDLSEFNTIRLFSEDLEQLWKYKLSHYWAGSLQAGSVLAFSPDESNVFFPGYRTDADVCVCNVETGDPNQILLGHEDDVSGLALSPDGNRLITVSRSELVLWLRSDDGFEQAGRVDEYGPAVQSITFLPHGGGFLTTARDDRRRLLTLFTISGDKLVPVSEYAIEDNNISYEFRHAAVTPDGEWVVSGYRDELYFFRISGDELVLEQTVSDIELGTVLTVGVTPDGRYAISGHFGALRWWRRSGDRWMSALTTDTQQPSTLDLAVAPGGTAMAVATAAPANALARFSLTGVAPSAAGRVAWALDGDLSAEQRVVLGPGVPQRIVERVGEARFAPRDMFETAEEFAERRRSVREEVQAALVAEIAVAYTLSRAYTESSENLEIPLADRGSYDVDSGRYEVGVLASRGWIQIDRDRARTLFQRWEQARVLATVTGERDETVVDFRLRHPVTGEEFPLVLERNPFTGAEMDEARTVIPALRVGPDLIIRDLSLEALFPTLRFSYARRPFGAFRLENAGSGIVSDVRAEFSIDGLSGSRRVALPASLAAGQQTDAELIAAVGGLLDGFPQGGSVGFQLTVSYRRGDRQVREEFSRQLRVLNRNAIQWDDDRKIAAFTSGSVPELVEIAARVAGNSEQTATTILSREILTAMELYSALGAYNISYVVDPNSAYADLSENAGAVDYVRFPLQTLGDRAGDCDDLSVLYASLLESVGVATAFVTTPGHLFMAFASGIDPTDAASVFESQDHYIVYDERVWLPVETTVMDEGFVTAWQIGAAQWQEAQESRSAGFFTTESAWLAFEPPPQPARSTQAPPLPLVTAGVRREIARFRELELEPKLDRAGAPGSSPASLNRRGTLLAAYGLLEEAQRWFTRATQDTEYVPALINLANISALNGDDETATVYLERAASIEPENPRVLLGLAVIYWESGERDQARITFDRASAIRPSLARRFPLLAGGSEPGTRAGGRSELFALDWAAP